MDNGDWLGQMNIIDLLRDVGKFFHVNNMLRLESVKNRLESGEGMTFTEFSYSLFQSYDFYHLYKNYGVSTQLGGSDQYGNIVSGIDYLKKRINLEKDAPSPVHCGGLTVPLLTTVDGKKFGKSEGNAIYLNPQKTSVYDMFQYFMRVHDSDACKFLRMLTFLPLEQIAQIELEHNLKPEARNAQRILAQEMVLALHGKEELAKVQQASQLLFDSNAPGSGEHGDVQVWTNEQINMLLKDAPRGRLSRQDTLSKPLFVILKECGMFKSTSEAKRMFKMGGIYVNNRREEDHGHIVTANELIEDRILLLRSGKKNYYIVEMQ